MNEIFFCSTYLIVVHIFRGFSNQPLNFFNTRVIRRFNCRMCFQTLQKKFIMKHFVQISLCHEISDIRSVPEKRPIMSTNDDLFTI